MDRFSSFLFGVGVGVGIGILFAPRSGEETRDLLMSKADEGRDYLKRQTQDLRGTASTLVDRGRDAVSRQRDSISEAFEAGKQAYREKVEQSAAHPA